MTDEQVIKRKLVFDGAGIDDKRLNLLQKMVVNWILSDYGSQEESNIMYNKILLQLNILEHSRRKSELVKLRNDRQLQQYRDYQMEIEKNVATIQEVINTSKVILIKVKSEKHQKLNYDIVVKDIVEQPSRIEMTKCVKQLQKDINDMKFLLQKLDNQFNILRKHFLVLLTNANEMHNRHNQFTENPPIEIENNSNNSSFR